MKSLFKFQLGAWNLYFIGKLFLYWKGLIGFHPIENLAFLVFIALPIPSRIWRWARTTLAFPLALALLYHDSWLPKFSRVMSQASLLKSFDAAYLIELLGRFINIQIIAVLALLLMLYWLLAHWIRVGVLVSGAIVASLVMQLSTSSVASPQVATSTPESRGGVKVSEATVDDRLTNFFREERPRKVEFTQPASASAPFDLIFIHICSLSRDDLAAVGLDNHPLWKKLDITLNHFNSAAAYSGPAAVRILRASCGQESQGELYSAAPQGCYLMEDLRQAGFATQLALNHDGHFEDFMKLVERQGINQPPLSLDQVTVAQHAFDDSPIFDDYAVLTRWLNQRQQQPSTRAALYYNTISLHDGNKLVGHAELGNSHQIYRLRVAHLLDELDRFMTDLDSSNHRAVVVIVPEHGAAYRGDKMQIAGLREIPSPAITLVPVGVKIVGAHVPRLGGNVSVADSTSYLALSQIVANLIKTSPFDAPSGYSPADYVKNLPTTPYVSQQGEETMVRFNGKYFLQQENKGAWEPYDSE